MQIAKRSVTNNFILIRLADKHRGDGLRYSTDRYQRKCVYFLIGVAFNSLVPSICSYGMMAMMKP